MFFVVLQPNKAPLEQCFIDMASAQKAIARIEPDVIAQAAYQIHPIHNLGDLKRLSLKRIETVTLEKFDGEYVGQPPVEVITSRTEI